ncbi:MAG: hypothetical protein QJT81_19465 [Candidatus Thiothrix putei]|uniref:Tetratricopeptide repeat protein n=1 Tax=Candidatus Thiothrix putei TaxID=3080811 RepID=A0AA95HE63_9GAMM|nr:MAG: hypothetical protein QJT81_19465 [Candidatus Thiothrix putei]
MHIFRWLMKHPILLAWLLAIIAILLNFSMGSKQGEHGNEVAATAHEQPSAVEHNQTAVVAQQTAPVAEPQAVAAPAEVVTQQAAPVAEPQAAAAAEVVATQQTAPVAEPQAAAPAEVATQQAAPVAEPQAATQTAATAQVVASADMLRAAREAYWANELDRAVGLYNDLLKQTPDSLEYKGELANVYWKQGNAQQAATLFAEVAPKLAEQGRVTEALNMKLYVDMVNPDLAKQIDAALKK